MAGTSNFQFLLGGSQLSSTVARAAQGSATDQQFINLEGLSQQAALLPSLGLAGNIQIPAEPITTPAYETVTEFAGSLQRADDVLNLFYSAKRGILDLRDVALLPLPGRDRSLQDRVTDYINDHVAPQEDQPAEVRAARQKELEELLGQFLDESGSFVFPAPEPISDPGVSRTLDQPGGPVTFQETKHSALFGTGRVVTGDIRKVDILRNALTVIRRRRQQILERKRRELEQLDQEIAARGPELAAADGDRREALGDYAIAQQLVTQDWSAVEQAFARRREVLEAHLGLYYVRVRETPVSRPLPDPLWLRHGAADDLVPGCAVQDVDLPDALAPFMETVLDVPVGDWAALRELHHLLPDRARLERLVLRRRQLLNLRLNQGPPAAGNPRLAALQLGHLALARELVKRPFSATGSLGEVQRQSRQVLSLDDLLSGPPHRLRGRAQQLQDHLDAAAGCLLARLRSVSPSVRLRWAEAAEADRLPVDDVSRWPGLERAEAEDFNGVRTLVELVAWWFRQLHPEAGAASRTALRDYIRACLLFAVGDDPQDVLSGRLTTVPPRLTLGDTLRLTLNREALAGTSLQLLDAAQRVVGVLRVEDHDAQGTVATVQQVLDDAAQPSQAFQVTGVLSALSLNH